VNDAQRQPILETLSDAEKDALILRLWDDLREEQARAQVLQQRLLQPEGEIAAKEIADDAAPSPLLAQLQERGTDKRRSTQAASGVKVRLGSGLGFLRSDAMLGLIAFVALAFGLDYLIGWYQGHRLEQKRLAGLQLEHAAYAGLYVEVANVVYEPDRKSYRLTMVMRNLDPQNPIYVMHGPVRVFEQSGLAWREVPAHVPDGATATVVKLRDQQAYETVFEPNLADWTELIPGYMHIRFESSSLISRRSEPDDDIVDRTDRTYVYLKPHGADDEAIRKRMKYPGTPPVYIPMPPH
jgi:hypothetical protein